MCATGLVGIAGLQEPSSERLKILNIAILHIPEMDADKYLFKCRHKASCLG